MDPVEVRVIDIILPTMITALLAGSLGAFAASEPTPSLAEQKGARELATLGGLGNVYPVLMLANPAHVAPPSETMKRFVRALRRAERYVVDHPGGTATLMAAETGLSPGTTTAAMQHHDYRLRLDEEIRDSLTQTARFLKRQGIIDREPDFSVVLEAEALRDRSD